MKKLVLTAFFFLTYSVCGWSANNAVYAGINGFWSTGLGGGISVGGEFETVNNSAVRLETGVAMISNGTAALFKVVPIFFVPFKPLDSLFMGCGFGSYMGISNNRLYPFLEILSGFRLFSFYNGDSKSFMSNLFFEPNLGLRIHLITDNKVTPAYLVGCNFGWRF